MKINLKKNYLSFSLVDIYWTVAFRILLYLTNLALFNFDEFLSLLATLDLREETDRAVFGVAELEFLAE